MMKLCYNNAENIRENEGYIVYKKHREKGENKMKKFLKEFKQFALRGNVMDMAVGIIIGGAFTGIVTSLTENFINPILNLLTGQAVYTRQDVIGFVCAFLTAVLNFIIMAFILFCLIKGINKMASIGQKKKSRRRLLQKYVLTAKARFRWKQQGVVIVPLS